MFWMVGVLEPGRLLDVYLLLQQSIGEGNFNIHLLTLETMMKYICRKGAYRLESSNRCNCLAIIHAINLGVPLGH